MLQPRFEPTADFEMKRRQSAILAAMEKQDIDAIVMYNFGDMVAGAFKYATDRSFAYPLAAILSKEGIAYFAQGISKDLNEEQPFVNIGDRLPVSEWSCPFLPGVTYNASKYGEAMTAFIKRHGFKKIGWVGKTFIPASIYEYLLQNNSQVQFVDFTPAMDQIRLVKSPWEIERFLRCVDLHDRLIKACQAMIRPHLTTHMLNLEIMNAAAQLGAVEFNTQLINLWRKDTALGPDEQIQPGDYIWVLIEVAGVGGEWGECARLFRLGEEPEQKWIDISNNLIKIQDAVAAACKPGAIPEEIGALCNRMLREYGYPEERRLCIHGQTYDIVDLPLFTPGDKTPLEENVFFTIHPTYYSSAECNFKLGPVFNHTDDFLVTAEGAKILSKTPRGIITVGV